MARRRWQDCRNDWEGRATIRRRGIVGSDFSLQMCIWLDLVFGHCSLQFFYYLQMSHYERNSIPKSGLKLSSSTSCSVPWILNLTRNRTTFIATNLMPSSARDASRTHLHARVLKSRHCHQIPRVCHFHHLLLTNSWQRRSTSAKVVLTQFAYQLPTPTYFLTFGAPIIFRRFHGRPQERVVGHGPSLSVRWVKWKGKLCVDLDIKWNSTFVNFLGRSVFRRKLYHYSKNSCSTPPIRLREHLTALPIFPLRIIKPKAYWRPSLPRWRHPSSWRIQNTRLDRYIPSRTWLV